MQPLKPYHVNYNPNKDVCEQLKYYKQHHNESGSLITVYKPLLFNCKLLKVASQTKTTAIRLSTSESLLKPTESILKYHIVYKIIDANTEHDYGEVGKDNINRAIKNIFGIKDSEDATSKT